MTTTIDVIDEAISLAAAETGTRGVKSSIHLCFASTVKKARRWTQEEENFIKENHGRLPESEIAKQLSRTQVGLHIHREREMYLASMSKSFDILTGEQVANGLGIDGKSVHLLMDTGRMPCRRLPSVRAMRVIDRIVLMKWILNPENWLYFKPLRVGLLYRKGQRGPGGNYDFSFWENARVIILKARRKWKDQWLSPGQVVKLLKIRPKKTPRRKLSDRIPGVRYVNKAILKGNLKAKRWGNWWIKKSDLPIKGKTINFKGEVVLRKKLYIN